MNPLYDLCNKIFYDALIQPEPQKDEIGTLIAMIKRNHFSEKTIILADRGYESYNVMAHLLEKPNTDFLIRIKQNHSAMREVARLPMFELDCDIGFTITTTQTKEDKESGAGDMGGADNVQLPWRYFLERPVFSFFAGITLALKLQPVQNML